MGNLIWFFLYTGKIIYPGKMTKALCFRIGNIGNLFPKDMIELVSAIKETLTEMNVHLPVKSWNKCLKLKFFKLMNCFLNKNFFFIKKNKVVWIQII